jgi:hypothetical protein
MTVLPEPAEARSRVPGGTPFFGDEDGDVKRSFWSKRNKFPGRDYLVCCPCRSLLENEHPTYIGSPKEREH